VVRPVRPYVVPHQVFEVLTVIGDDSPLLPLRHLEHVRVVEATLLPIGGHGDHVMTQTPEPLRHIVAEVLI
jgi:hypothetical protein